MKLNSRDKKTLTESEAVHCGGEKEKMGTREK
jgi:hypothetical protein